MRLLEHGTLRPAELKISKEMLDNGKLLELWQMAKEVCANRFSALAFSQIPDGYFPWGENYRNIVFVNNEKDDMENFPYRDCLLINPEIFYRHGTFLWPEGCGSIVDSGVGYLIIRPRQIGVETLVWEPKAKQLNYARFYSLNQEAAIMEHETDHLNGKTALDFRQKIIDHRKLIYLSDWKDLGWIIYGNDPKLTLSKLHDYWVVPEGEEGWALVNPFGEKLADFTAGKWPMDWPADQDRNRRAGRLG